MAQVFEQAFGVGVDRVGVDRESLLLQWVLATYRIEIPARRGLAFRPADGLKREVDEPRGESEADH